MSGKTKTVISSLAIILAFGAIFALVAYLRNGPLKMFNSEDEQLKSVPTWKTNITRGS